MDPKLPRADWQASRYCKFECDRESWDCDLQTCTEGKFGYECDANHQRIAIKGYTPRLAGSSYWGSPGDGKCVWATMSREPVSRLISSFYYCQNEWEKDPLCGFNRLAAKDATLRDWANHWGNFLFRELMQNPQLMQAAANRRNFNASAVDCSMDPWVQFKDQLNGGDDPRTADGKMNLEAVKEALRGEGGWKPLYDIYGVVEMWNETMTMLDESFPLDGQSWLISGNGRVTDHGSSDYKREELNALDKARKDPEVLAALAADIELYNDVIVPLFLKKVKEERLVQKAVDIFDDECSKKRQFCNANLEETQTMISMGSKA